MMILPDGHFWVHNGGLYFSCKKCKTRIVKEIRSTDSGFECFYRIQICIDHTKWIISDEKIPDSCDEVNMSEALK